MGEQVIQSIALGNGRVPLVSMQTCLPAWCRRSISSSSIQSPGSPPDPESGLATGQDNEFGRILVDGLDNRRVLHPGSLLMAGIAEITFEVAPREADKDCRRTGMESLALQAVEYLVNLSHRSPCCLRILELPP